MPQQTRQAIGVVGIRLLTSKRLDLFRIRQKESLDFLPKYRGGFHH
jgi:hypothetical protein